MAVTTVNLGSVVGPAGPGVPKGGTKGDFLVKLSDDDYDAHWTSMSRRPVRNADGYYDNESIRDWIRTYQDGLEYGVRINKFSYNTSYTATSLGAAVGMSCEPSTLTAAGVNDYDKTAVGFCTRCNIDKSDSSEIKITAIEGLDDDFSTSNETWSIRANKYYRVDSSNSNWDDIYICDTNLGGDYKPFPKNDIPYIAELGFHLTACYLDSDGTMSSRAGEIPSSYVINTQSNYFQHSQENDAAASKDSGVYTFLSYADIFEQIICMQVMLGIKGPKQKASGRINRFKNVPTAGMSEAPSGHNTLADWPTSTETPQVGEVYMNQYHGGTVWDNSSNNIKEAVVTAIDGTSVTFDRDPSFLLDISYIGTFKVLTGFLDNVMGSYGSLTTGDVTSGNFPFKFMNVEWLNGIWEVCCDIVRNGASVYRYDVKNATKYSEPESLSCLTSNGWVADYGISDDGVLIPQTLGASSSTGWTVYWDSNAYNTNNREWIVGGGGGGAYHSRSGVGRVASNSTVSASGWDRGGRASTLGA